MAATFTHPVDVRYLEVDQQGVVFNMWYLAYFDDAMSALIEARGLPYQQMREDGYDVQLVHTELDWASSLRFGAPAFVDVAVEALGRTSFALAFAVRQDDRTTCTARTVYVCVGLEDGAKRALPAGLRAALTG